MARRAVILELACGCPPIAVPLLRQRFDHRLILRLLDQTKGRFDDFALHGRIVRWARCVSEWIVEERCSRWIG